MEVIEVSHGNTNDLLFFYGWLWFEDEFGKNKWNFRVLGLFEARIIDPGVDPRINSSKFSWFLREIHIHIAAGKIGFLKSRSRRLIDFIIRTGDAIAFWTAGKANYAWRSANGDWVGVIYAYVV